MKPILIIKTGHTLQRAFELAGDFESWIIDSMQASADEVSVVSVYKEEKLPHHDAVAGTIITGSPAMVTERLPWSEYAADWLRHAVVTQMPILGICYGHQLLAHALGGEVAYHPKGREIGTTMIRLLDEAGDDALFTGVEQQFPAHVSHMQSVVRLPAGAKVLGKNDFEDFHAVQFADRTWGLQFHPEFNETIMRAYVEERQQALREEGLDVETIMAAIQETTVASSLMRKFYRLVRSYSV